jgi:hypothetical protein
VVPILNCIWYVLNPSKMDSVTKNGEIFISSQNLLKFYL